MSDTKGSTVCSEDVLRRFDANPVGFTVQLDNGTTAEVSSWRDTPKGRWYRLKRRGGPWVPDAAVVGVMVFSVGLVRDAAPVQLGAAS